VQHGDEIHQKPDIERDGDDRDQPRQRRQDEERHDLDDLDADQDELQPDDQKRASSKLPVPPKNPPIRCTAWIVR
jgi:hypothetical protein